MSVSKFKIGDRVIVRGENNSVIVEHDGIRYRTSQYIAVHNGNSGIIVCIDQDILGCFVYDVSMGGYKGVSGVREFDIDLDVCYYRNQRLEDIGI